MRGQTKPNKKFHSINFNHSSTLKDSAEGKFPVLNQKNSKNNLNQSNATTHISGKNSFGGSPYVSSSQATPYKLSGASPVINADNTSKMFFSGDKKKSQKRLSSKQIKNESEKVEEFSSSMNEFNKGNSLKNSYSKNNMSDNKEKKTSLSPVISSSNKNSLMDVFNRINNIGPKMSSQTSDKKDPNKQSEYSDNPLYANSPFIIRQNNSKKESDDKILNNFMLNSPEPKETRKGGNSSNNLIKAQDKSHSPKHNTNLNLKSIKQEDFKDTVSLYFYLLFQIEYAKT